LKKDEGYYQEQINAVKMAVLGLERMLPGSLTLQKRSCGKGNHYLSCTFQGEGHTLYVREDDIDQVREEVENYRDFRSLVNRWVELEIKYSRLRRSGS